VGGGAPGGGGGAGCAACRAKFSRALRGSPRAHFPPTPRSSLHARAPRQPVDGQNVDRHRVPGGPRPDLRLQRCAPPPFLRLRRPPLPLSSPAPRLTPPAAPPRHPPRPAVSVGIAGSLVALAAAFYFARQVRGAAPPPARRPGCARFPAPHPTRPRPRARPHAHARRPPRPPSPCPRAGVRRECRHARGAAPEQAGAVSAAAGPRGRGTTRHFPPSTTRPAGARARVPRMAAPAHRRGGVGSALRHISPRPCGRLRAPAAAWRRVTVA
jgi:hypothetical protein